MRGQNEDSRNRGSSQNLHHDDAMNPPQQYPSLSKDVSRGRLRPNDVNVNQSSNFRNKNAGSIEQR